MTVLRGVILRGGLASLPLVAIVLLCVAMFSGLGRHKAASGFNVQTALIPSAEAAPSVEKATLEASDRQLVQAAFERLHVTHATIRVPN